jgi:1-acyl-sn-glycerol-3-phosphate acyltransferase
MAQQEVGWIGRLVGGMIRRSVRRHFRGLYWNPPKHLPGRVIFACNHHNWFDGYVMFHVVQALHRPSLDWIQEFDAFPLFSKVGGMPFPKDDPARRAATIRRTLRLMQREGRSLVIFPEGVLHAPPEVLPLGEALARVARSSNTPVVPTALVYEFALHQRPEAFIHFGSPREPDQRDLANMVRQDLVSLIHETQTRARERPESFETLAKGTLDVNERWDMRRRP